MACCPVAFCSTMVDSETELTLHRFYHFVVYTTYKICGIHHLQYMAYAIFKGLFIQERLWNTPRTRFGLVVYTTYNIWLTPFSRLDYTRGVVEYTTYKVWLLWYTPHTRYGIRHFQGLFIQEGLWNTPRTRFGFVVYTTYDIWHTPFSRIIYTRGVVEYTTYKVWVCGIHHIRDMAYAIFKDYLYKRGCGIHHVQGLGLWYTPRTRYGIRHFQVLFCTRGCGIHHLQYMAYTMFKIIGLCLGIILYTSLFATFPTPPHSHPPSYIPYYLFYLREKRYLVSTLLLLTTFTLTLTLLK